MNQHEETERRLAALMRAAQDGDGAAYAAIAPGDHAAAAGQDSAAASVSCKPEDVEDLVQDVLLSLHAVRATYDPRRPFLPWLFGIVQNRVADWCQALCPPCGA